MIQYVVGFAFTRKKDKVILMLKKKPEWQKGKFNGVGGKIDAEDDSPLSAMIREFKEETGVETIHEMWRHFATLKFDSCTLFCFAMYSNAVYQCETKEEEMVLLFEMDKLPHEMIPNLKVLIPMALDEDFTYAEIEAVVR